MTLPELYFLIDKKKAEPNPPKKGFIVWLKRVYRWSLK